MFRWRTVWLAALTAPMAAVLLASAVVAAPLKTVSVSAAPSGLRIDIAATAEKRAPTSFALDGPKRLVVDLPGVSTTSANWPGAGSVIKVRAAQFDADTARVVFDLSASARISASSAEDGHLILNVVPVDDVDFAKLVAAGRKTLAQPPEPKPAVKPPVERAPAVALKPEPQPAKPEPKVAVAAPKVEQPATKPPQKAAPVQVAAVTPRPPIARPRARTGLPVVVIDAGHGGKDVGAVSVLGKTVYEKDAVLRIAKAIKKELDASGRVRAILTRSDDTYLRHRDRFELARRNRAELFISIHADSAPTPAASGATVYTLSETASDAEAARLAAKENRSDIIAGVDLGIETSEVSDILIDLAQRETMNTSAQFAAILQREIRQDVKVKSQFHRFAGFLVLKAPDVPSVLLECGYLSNEQDSKFIMSASGQARIAKGVRRAVEAHFLRRLAQR